MQLFKKRESLTENLTYMGMMAAINVVFVLITTLVPYLLFLLVFVLPLTNCIVTIFCKKKYFPIYAIATIALCMAITPWNISDTIFYVIPSIITGFLYGIFVKIKFPSILTICAISLIQIGLTYSALPIVKLITQIDMIEMFAKVFQVYEHPYLSYIAPLFITFISILQTTFAYLIIREELPKIGEQISYNAKHFFTIPLINFSALILITVFAFVYPQIAYVILCFSLVLVVYEIVEIIAYTNKVILIVLAVSTFLSIFIFAATYSLVPNPYGLLLVGMWFIMVTIIALVNNYLSYNRTKDTI